MLHAKLSERRRRKERREKEKVRERSREREREKYMRIESGGWWKERRDREGSVKIRDCRRQVTVCD